MERNWAAEHLQVIRTLMERSAVYRRALAPIMFLLGALGTVAAGIGALFGVQAGAAFGWYWLGVAIVGVCGGLMMIRRQAWKAKEPFWSPPTRRVTQAVLPPLFAGFAATVFLLGGNETPAEFAKWLPPVWMMLYGCAVHAAGFFMPRGMKLFGWIFLLSGSAAAAGAATWESALPPGLLHGVMGLFFGGLHLAYAVYLSFTESRNEM